jgi:hypothetical protein
MGKPNVLPLTSITYLLPLMKLPLEDQYKMLSMFKEKKWDWKTLKQQTVLRVGRIICERHILSKLKQKNINMTIDEVMKEYPILNQVIEMFVQQQQQKRKEENQKK